jgi:hypothetical protein
MYILDAVIKVLKTNDSTSLFLSIYNFCHDRNDSSDQIQLYTVESMTYQDIFVLKFSNIARFYIEIGNNFDR